MANIHETLARFDPSKNEKYDPGKIIIFFDARMSKTSDDNFSYFQSYWTQGLYSLGWTSLYKPDLNPGFLRLVWYTHVGNEGSRDFPLYKAYLVKEMFDSLADEGFRPMLMGWSGENPFPMIGGSEPPEEPKAPVVRKATTWSGAVSGHGKGDSTPHDRVMAIIEEEENREAKEREKSVRGFEEEKGVQSVV